MKSLQKMNTHSKLAGAIHKTKIKNRNPVKPVSEEANRKSMEYKMKTGLDFMESKKQYPSLLFNFITPPIVKETEDVYFNNYYSTESKETEELEDPLEKILIESCEAILIEPASQTIN